MHFLLIGLGLLAAACGAAAIGIGLPQRSAPFGGTLIVSGTIGLVGGLLLLAAGVIVRRLGKVIEALETRPMPLAVSTELDLSRRVRDLRAEIAAAERSEVRSPEAEEALARVAAAAAEPPAYEEPRRPPRGIVPDPADEVRREPPMAPEPPARSLAAEPPARSFSPAEVHAAAVELAEPAAQPEPAAPSEPAILKSGVIDGMAYTLYDDGSIDAELPRGIMRFNSISALRAYLNQSA